MKKILFVVAAAALTLASCGNKANAPEAAVDSTEVALQDANQAADDMVANLTELLNGQDANALQTALEAAKAKIAELVALNPDAAKEYLTKVQDFLKENADKVKGLVGDNAAVTAAVSALTDAPVDNIVSGLVSSVNGAAADAVEGAQNAVDNAKDAVENAANQAVEDAKDAANKAVEDAKAATVDKANEAVNNAKESAAKSIDDAASAAKKKLGL